MLYKKILMIAALAFGAAFSHAQNVSGRDFWMTMPENSGGVAIDNDYIVTIVSDYCAEYTIEIPGLNWSQTAILQQGVPNDIVLPNTIAGETIYHNRPFNIQGKGIHVYADQQVTVYMFMMTPFSSDAETIIPTNQLGTEYVVGFNSAMRSGSTAMARTAVVATEDSTNVVINRWTNGGTGAGTPQQDVVLLHRGETYQFLQNSSYTGAEWQTTYQMWAQTGSTVTADKPVAVVSSVPCSDMAQCGPCDGMMTMVTPINQWGDRFIIAQTMPRMPVQFCGGTNGLADFIQVIGEIGTNVTFESLSGTTTLPIIAPPYAQTNHYGYGYVVYNNDPYNDGSLGGGPESGGEANVIVTSDRPVQVIQYQKAGGYDSQGTAVNLDPEAIVIYPESWWESSYLFTNAAGGFAARTSPNAVIVVKNDPVAGQPDPIDDIFIDGTNVNNLPFNANWQAFGPPAQNYHFTRVPFAALTSHQIISQSDYDFGIYIYATATAESYIYQGGSSPILEIPCPDCPIAQFTGNNVICLNDPVTFVDQSRDTLFNIVQWKWNFGDGDSLITGASTNPTHTYDSIGQYDITLQVINDASPPCTTQFMYNVDVKELPVYNIADTSKCNDDTLALNYGDPFPAGTGPYNYTWSPNVDISDPNILQPDVWPSVATTYTLDITDFYGCESQTQVTVSIGGGDSIFIEPDETICLGDNSQLDFRLVTVDPGYAYDFKVYNGTDTLFFNNITAPGTSHILTGLLDTTEYWIIDASPSNGDESCIVIEQDSATINVKSIPKVTFAPDTTICVGDSVGLRFHMTGNGPWEVGYHDEVGEFSFTVNTQDTVVYVSPTDTMDYTLDYVKYTDLPDCEYALDSTITVNVNTLPTVSWTVPTPICQEDTTWIQFNINNGNAPFYVLYTEAGVLDSVLVDGVAPDEVGVHPDVTTQYKLIGVNSANFPYCGSTNTEVENIVVETIFKAGNDTTLDICTSEPQDLFQLIGGLAEASNTGTWTDDDGSGGTLTPAGLYNPSGVSTGTYRFTYFVDNNVPCIDQQSTVTLNIYENPTGSFTAPAEICSGTDANLKFSLTGTAPFSVVMNRNSVPFTTNNVYTGDSLIENLTATTTYDFVQVTDGSPAGCIATINQTRTVTVNNAPKLFLDSAECDATGENYVFYLDVVGGDPATYFDNPIVPTTSGSFYESPVGSGNWRYKSASLPTQTFAQIFIDDAKGCGPVLWDEGHACDCKSDAGDIIASSQTICGTDLTVVTPTGNAADTMFLDANDVVEYYLYTNIDLTNGELLGVIDSSATGAFAYDAASMTYGTTYYVVRAVGSEDGTTGSVDRADLCLSLSTSIPVTFYPTPAITWSGNSPVCDGFASTIDVILTTGTAPFDLVYNPGIPITLNNDTDIVNITSGNLLVGNNTFEVTSITDFHGCQLTGSPIASTNILVHPLPMVSLSTNPANQNICEGDNVDLIFDFSVSTATPYKVNYDANTTPQTVINTSSDPHTETLSPSTTTLYEVTSVEDANGCIGGYDSLTVTVNLIPDYTITFDKDEICEGDTATITFNITKGLATIPVSPSEVFEVDYTSDNPNDASGTITGLNNGGTFTISPATDGVYNYTFGEIRDSSPTVCSRTKAVTYNLTVYPTPQVTMTLLTPNEICDGDNIQLQFTTSNGTGPFVRHVEDELGTIYSSSPFGPAGSTGSTDILTFGSNPGQKIYRNVRVEDASGICVGTSNDVDTVTVYRIPSFTATGGGDLCEGTSVNILLNVKGDRPMDLGYDNPEGSGLNVYGEDSISFAATPPIGLSTYLFGGIQYSVAPICYNPKLDSVLFSVSQIADASITGNITMCDGESTNLTLNVSGGTPPFEVTYTDGVNTIVHPTLLQNGDVITVSPNDSTTYSLVSVIDQTPTNCAANLVGSDVVVNVNPTPEATISSPTGVCFNDTAWVVVTGTVGNMPFDIVINNNEGEVNTFNDVNPKDSIHHVAVASGISEYSIIQISDNTISGVSGQACVSTAAKTTTTVVNPLPEGVISLIDSSICEYETTFFRVDMTSSARGPFTLFYRINNVDYVEPNYNDGASVAIPQMTAGNYLIEVYRIDDDANPYACSSDPTFITGVNLVVNPTPVVKFSATEYADCASAPFKTRFINETDSSFMGTAEWNLDRGRRSIKWTNVDQTYNTAGYMDISLTVTSQYGCVATHKENDYVQAYPDPVVDFIYQPNPATLSNSGITLKNTTVGGSEFKWSIDTISNNPEENYITWPRTTTPDHYYYFNDEDPGQYRVLLESWSQHECYGLNDKIVSVEGELLVNIPNSFTPNGDGTNDYFRPYMFGYGEEFSFKVFNRWGELIFELYDYPKRGQQVENYGWDGRDMRNGEEVKTDVYVYRIVVQNRYSQQLEEFVGEINLMR